MRKTNFLSAIAAGTMVFAGSAAADNLGAMIDELNDSLEASGAGLAVGMVEWITEAESEEMGQTILFKDTGNKQLGFDFVPGDPRRGGRTNITYIMDAVDVTADATDEFAAIDNAMQTWEDAKCSDIPITDLGDVNADEGFVQWFFGFGGNSDINAPIVNGWDIAHDGFLPGNFFLAFGGSPNILGVAFTIIFPGTDIDNNGVGDAAYREIYYNDAFNWVDNPNDGPGDGLIDLESVALHEAGHGLSQGHFGNAAIINSNGRIRISPNAVMNAGYIFAEQDLQGNDRGGHCSNWANWPNN
ncbi:MAG: hypothetical protein HKN35_01905 [Woeseia sp.]|nr:hypothetical protein [Woeseia sp.]MBU2678555.1 hypothetical protein [Gammaproteobacteria bacterium]NNL52289.1 hypothetical protein [Woeseiaceae bacterium]MBT8097268.1 hypothetical protein [Woeseia sp.]NNE59631.1 hypothetical protein [Woeseia sp.]